MNQTTMLVLICAGLVGLYLFFNQNKDVTNISVSQSAKDCATACAKNYQMMERFTIKGECVCRGK